MSRTTLLPLALLALALPATAGVACSSNGNTSTIFPAGAGGAVSSGTTQPSTSTGVANGGAGTTDTSSSSGISLGGSPVGGDGGMCPIHCSPDHHQVLDCDGNVVADCGDAGTLACDLTSGACSSPCMAASDNRQSVGCDFYATYMESNFEGSCFAVYIANNWDTAAHLQDVTFGEETGVDPTQFTFLPQGAGPSLTYTPYDKTTGIPPGQVAVLFLGGVSAGNNPNNLPAPCPSVVSQTAYANGAMINGTGVGGSFHIKTDVPVVAYQINPYGGGAAAITGASLLLPTSVWDTNYVAVTASPQVPASMIGGFTYGPYNPSINIVAQADTTVTLLPTQAIVGGTAGGTTLPAGKAGAPYTFTLRQGQQAQFSQGADLTGTVISATAPVGVMAGNSCMQKPVGTNYCDHGEQMIPPVKSLGSEYVAVMWRPRTSGDASIWRIVGALDGTTLSYEPSTPPGAPTTIDAGQLVEFTTADPFVVTSQDATHPFMLFAQMPGATWSQLSTPGYGDPDFVLSVAPNQYLDNYVFMTDPTYPETNLVVVRAPNSKGVFSDVSLDCAGNLTGWQTLGKYQWTTIDLMRHNFEQQGNCSTGAHNMTSAGLFGLWVWGWGSPETQSGSCDSTQPNFTCYVSYGYPGGMNVSPVNTVVIMTQ